jgi:DNA-binding transcriptional LysR family regulator
VISEQLVRVAAPEFDLAQRPLPLVLFEDGCIIRDAATSALKNGKIPYRISHSSDANTMIITVINGGHAIGAMPRCTAEHAGLHQLVDCNLPPLPSVDICLMVRDHANPAVRELALGAIAALSPDEFAVDSIPA